MFSNPTILMYVLSTHNICFGKEIGKIFFHYSLLQCSAKKFQNWGQCPTTFEKVGTFPKIVGHNTGNDFEL